MTDIIVIPSDAVLKPCYKHHPVCLSVSQSLCHCISISISCVVISLSMHTPYNFERNNWFCSLLVSGQMFV